MKEFFTTDTLKGLHNWQYSGSAVMVKKFR